MKLRCLGSGSSGNCYILENNSEVLVIEAGISFMAVKKALDFNISRIVGVVVSHQHGDHSKYSAEYEKAGIPVFRPYESDMERQVRTYGEFVIKSFLLVHDVPCCGFLIRHLEAGNVLYVSDTEYIKYRFRDLSHIICECNYDEDCIDKDLPNYAHILQGHMSLNTCKGFIAENKSAALRNVILCHLSMRNADADKCEKEIKGVVDDSVIVGIAEKGMVFDLNLKGVGYER